MGEFCRAGWRGVCPSAPEFFRGMPVYWPIAHFLRVRGEITKSPRRNPRHVSKSSGLCRALFARMPAKTLKETSTSPGADQTVR